MSLISDALFLEATAADASRRRPIDTAGSAHVDVEQELELADIADLETPAVSPEEQAHAIAEWIYAGRSDQEARRATFPGLSWLRQPKTYSDREWILAIAKQYRQLDRAGNAAMH
jgi:hypothetical protein